MSRNNNSDKWSKVTKVYIKNIEPTLNQRALFSDGTINYRIPNEPMPYETVTIRFRTEKDNVDAVYLIIENENQKIRMELTSFDEIFDYYSIQIKLEDKKVEYFFEINANSNLCYYNRQGVSMEIQQYYNFQIMPGFHTPDWAKGAVFYQIFVDRFFNGDASNDVLDNEYIYIGEGTREVNRWDKYPDSMGVREFYGGDLSGVMKKLDYLQELGVDAIYFNPIFVSPSNHKYDIQDYDYVDPHYGAIVKEKGEVLDEGDKSNERAYRYITRVTDKENLEASNQLFIELVNEIHKRGMKVILDGVFNHCGSFNKWLDRERIYENQEGYDKGAYISEDSPYRTFFRFRGGNWPYNKQYDGWWGHDTLPKLNYEESDKLFDYIMEIARKWVSPPFNADGWRLDVAADLGYSNEFNHRFWKLFRKNVKEANPNAIIIAEHYGDPSSWLRGDEWDTVMNYDAFMEPITWFLTGVEKHSDEYHGDLFGSSENFFRSMKSSMVKFTTPSLEVSMNELSNHDHSRFLTRTNRKVGRTNTAGPREAEEGINKAIFREAVVMQMTWPGAPTIYYGDEAGVCGWTDPDNRRTYPWGREDVELIELHKELIRIHKDYNALKRGSILFLGGDYQYLSYGRFNEEDKFVVIINNIEYERTFVIPVWEIGITDQDRLVRLIQTTEEGYNLEAVHYQVEEDHLVIRVPAYSGTIVKNTEAY
ncbi:glycoside hydrolase family 13 protein [Anaeromicropila herbilytica]|uniref:Alpha-glycosidase n=1 Tax=Anaeromicropila herbilytica TaxID=2785025 RepID=A0A7R7EGX0_9FIRM|nr:glycoside hydrolase family 13 protein [Anaeromicropila herbilytica]BCN28990.1 alpha-glycosidase [Anaeromicropila herbilytica]